MSAELAVLERLIQPLQTVWSELYGGQLWLTPEEPRGEGLSTAIAGKEGIYAWFQAEAPPETGDAALHLLESWGGLVGAFLDEHAIAEGLTSELITAWNRLTFLNSVIALIRTTTDPIDRARKSLRLLAQAIDVENAFLSLEVSGKMTLVWATPSSRWQGFRTQFIHALDKPPGRLLCNDPDQRLRSLPGIDHLETFLGEKISRGESPPMYVGVVNHAQGRFNAGDLQIFDSLLEMLVSFMQSAALHGKEQEVEILNRDLTLAAEIQANFLSSKLPQLDGREFATARISASKLGGDLLDIIERGPGQGAVIVCDVSGKGVPAALLAAELRVVLRSEVRKSAEPDVVLQRVNAEMFDDMEQNDRFATSLLMVLGPGEDDVQYASAGHTTALLIRADPLQIDELPSTTLPLGIFRELDPGCREVAFRPGDVLLIYSDGLTETEDEHGNLLGLDGVIRVLLGTHNAPAQVIADSLVLASRRHRGDAPLQDDLTLAVIRRLADGYQAPVYLDPLHLIGDRSVLSSVEARLNLLRQRLPQTEASDKWLLQIQLAITEVVSNIIVHAYSGQRGEIDGLIALYSDRVEIDLVDAGTGFEPREVTPPKIDADDLPEGGFGLWIVHEVMDEVDYYRLSDRYNHWRFSRRLAAE